MYVVIMITWILLQFSTWRTDAVTITLNLTTPYVVNQTNTLNPLSTPSLYSAFLDQIRNNVRDSSLKYGGTDISVIGAPSRNKFLNVGFEHARGLVILGFRRDNLYLVAYVALDNANVNRAYYFRNQINSAELTALFPEVKPANHKPLEYGEDYQSIEKNAKITDRKQLGLGIDLLESMIDKVSNKARVVKDEARFLLIAIQMTAEAVRFRYIQNLVNKNFPYKFDSTNKVIQFQVSWSKISKAIHDDCKNGVLNRDYDFGFGKVRRAKDFQMGLLMYLGKA